MFSFSLLPNCQAPILLLWENKKAMELTMLHNILCHDPLLAERLDVLEKVFVLKFIVSFKECDPCRTVANEVCVLRRFDTRRLEVYAIECSDQNVVDQSHLGRDSRELVILLAENEVRAHSHIHRGILSL